MKKKTNYFNKFNIKEKITSFIANKESNLFDFIQEKMPEKSRTAIKDMLLNKQVRVNNQVETNYNFKISINDKLLISNLKAPREIPLKNLNIIYEDKDIIVINKNKGLLSVATEKESEKTVYNILSNYVKQADPKTQIHIVYRLDKESSGIMLLTKNMDLKKSLYTLWKSKEITTKYYLVVEGEVKQLTGNIHSWLAVNKNYVVYSTDNPNKGYEAETVYKVLKKNQNYSLLEVQLNSQRKSQIRVHMQDIGHSIVGDKKYGASGDNPINRLALHTYFLSFTHPVTGELMKFETPIPAEFNKLFKKSDIVKY